MSKNWKTRIREVAENRPDKLHPMLKGMMAKPPRSEAWDRVTWQLDGDGEISASAAARPIIAMLQWLNSRSLLTGLGKSLFKSIGRIDPATVSLTRDLVKPSAWAFLDAKYQHWHDTHAINYAIDQSFEFGDHSELDELWAGFSRMK